MLRLFFFVVWRLKIKTPVSKGHRGCPANFFLFLHPIKVVHFWVT